MTFRLIVTFSPTHTVSAPLAHVISHVSHKTTEREMKVCGTQSRGRELGEEEMNN